MIIMILIIAAFAISATVVALVLLGVIDAYTDEAPFTATAVVCGLSTAALLICGITCIVNSQPSSIATCEYALAEKIELYKNDKRLIESYHPVTDGSHTTFTSDITFEAVSTARYYEMVQEYNKAVFDFKVEIIGAQRSLSNPWVSWFFNPGYASVTEEALKSLEYTIGR